MTDSGLPGHFPGCPRYDHANPFAGDWCDCAQARAEGEVPPITLSDVDVVPLNAEWRVSWSLRVNGRQVARGTEVSISREPGRFTFCRHVLNPANGAEWVDVYGGPKGRETSRAFHPSRITTVHRLKKARPT